MRERFSFAQRMSVRPQDISQSLLNSRPQIVHFSGHGNADGSLYFENRSGRTQVVQPGALAALFKMFVGQVHCVVLNACYSKAQAKAINKHIPYVIGMKQQVGDKAAIAFSAGFYKALGAGRTIEDAYRLGCAEIALENLPGHLIPVLLKKREEVSRAGNL
jgi:hypothetical protein